MLSFSLCHFRIWAETKFVCKKAPENNFNLANKISIPMEPAILFYVDKLEPKLALEANLKIYQFSCFHQEMKR